MKRTMDKVLAAEAVTDVAPAVAVSSAASSAASSVSSRSAASPAASGVELGKLTQAGVRRWLARGHSRDYRDPSQPKLRLRSNRARTRASVFLVLNENNKTPWKKLGDWPGLCLTTLTAQLPVMLAGRALGEELTAERFADVGALLLWYASRVESLGRYSASWQRNVRSVVGRQLLPRLGSVSVSQLSFAALDELLVLPMTRESYSQSYIKTVVKVLLTAMGAAVKQRLVGSNPLAGYVVAESVAVRARDARLYDADFEALFARLTAASMPVGVLFVLMLMFGTRIGETRRVRWDQLAGGVWLIPASHTKSGQEHRLPLTAAASQLIERYRRWQLKHVGKRAFLFPGRDGGCISVRTAQLWSADIRFKHFTSHDLRKLMRTVVADLGVDTVIGERLLNHALPALLQTYVKSTLDKGMAAALEQYHGYLLSRGLCPDGAPDSGQVEDNLEMVTIGCGTKLAGEQAKTGLRSSSDVEMAQSKAASGWL